MKGVKARYDRTRSFDRSASRVLRVTSTTMDDLLDASTQTIPMSRVDLTGTTDTIDLEFPAKLYFEKRHMPWSLFPVVIRKENQDELYGFWAFVPGQEYGEEALQRKFVLSRSQDVFRSTEYGRLRRQSIDGSVHPFQSYDTLPEALATAHRQLVGTALELDESPLLSVDRIHKNPDRLPTVIQGYVQDSSSDYVIVISNKSSPVSVIHECKLLFSGGNPLAASVEVYERKLSGSNVTFDLKEETRGYDALDKVLDLQQVSGITIEAWEFQAKDERWARHNKLEIKVCGNQFLLNLARNIDESGEFPALRSCEYEPLT